MNNWRTQIAKLESSYGKGNVIETCIPNPETCDKIKIFVESRYIADPLVAPSVFPNLKA